ncbi:unnamed protein product [Amaranthus hypochondriacus]
MSSRGAARSRKKGARKNKSMSSIGCECDKVLVILAENDRYGLYNIGENYVKELKISGWEGTVEMMVNEGKDHCFMLSDHLNPQPVTVRKRIVSFIYNQDLES